MNSSVASRPSICHAKLCFLSVEFGDHAPLVYGFLLSVDKDELAGIAAAMAGCALLVAVGCVLIPPMNRGWIKIFKLKVHYVLHGLVVARVELHAHKVQVLLGLLGAATHGCDASAFEHDVGLDAALDQASNFFEWNDGNWFLGLFLECLHVFV